MTHRTPDDLKARAAELRDREPELRRSTQRTYDSAWARFESWCGRRGCSALPATPDAVMNHFSEHALRLSLAALRNARRAISLRHREAGEDDPTEHDNVRAIWMAVLEMHREREHDEAEDVEVDIDEVLTDELKRMIEKLPDTLAGKRDRVALLLGAAAGLERGELAAVRFDEVEATDGGVRLRIGSTSASPRVVRVLKARDPRFRVGDAIEAWLEAADITDGPLLRAVDRHGNVGARRLSVRSVSALVRRAAEEAQIEGEGYGYGQLVTQTRMRE